MFYQGREQNDMFIPFNFHPLYSGTIDMVLNFTPNSPVLCVVLPSINRLKVNMNINHCVSRARARVCVSLCVCNGD